MKKLSLLLAIVIVSLQLGAQETNSRLSIFVDCQMRCDFTYIKQEITFVDYMQDRFQANVYVLATRQRTGSGGNEVRLSFQGNDEYSTIQDTLIYYVDANATEAISREIFVTNLKKGLLPFLIASSNPPDIEYNIVTSDEKEEDRINTIDDPWNYWVFNIGGNGFFNGEASFSNSDVSGRFSASRVTLENKFFIRFRYNYERSKFTLTDGEEIISIIKRYNNFARYVFSINDHWSVGFNASQGSSSFGNTDIEGSIKPAIEYNIYPYSESSTRRFTLLYELGPEYKNYTEETIFDKLSETVMRHNLRVEIDQTQKWGDLSIEMGASQYLHDLSLFSIFINPNIEWNIVKGLSVDFGGFVSWVSDRINIAKSDISDEDILLQIKQLDTDYTFFSYVGINYRFGSKYNNFVNPRF